MNPRLTKIFAERDEIDRALVANAVLRSICAGDLGLMVLERTTLERRRAELIAEAHDIDQAEKRARDSGSRRQPGK